MAAKKNKKETVKITPFKDRPNNYFVNFKHYVVNDVDGSVEIVSGGVYDESDAVLLRSFIGTTSSAKK